MENSTALDMEIELILIRKILIYNIFYLNDANMPPRHEKSYRSARPISKSFSTPVGRLLRPHQPIAKIGYSIFIYDLSGTLGGIDGIGADLCCRRTVTRDEVSQSR
jgi:hypothetical protein